MNATMFETLLERQNEKMVTTVRDLAKLFGVKNSAVIEELKQPVEGYTIEFSDEQPLGTSSIIVFDADENESPLSISQQEVESDRDVVTPDAEPIDPDDMPVAAVAEEAAAEEATTAEAPTAAVRSSRSFTPGIYPNFATKEEADAAHPEGYVSVAEMHLHFVNEKIPVSRFVKAMGGDRMVNAPRSDSWKPFTIGTSPKRYVSNMAFQEVEAIRAEADERKAPKPPKEPKAAKAPKEPKAPKAPRKAVVAKTTPEAVKEVETVAQA